MSDAPGEWVAVTTVNALSEGAVACATTAAGEVAVFNVDGDVLAVEARCLHKGGRLAEGMVSDGIVTCPLHWWRYDLRTGERLGAPDLRLSCYPVRVVEDRVEVLVSSPPQPAPSLRDRLLAAGREWETDRRPT